MGSGGVLDGEVSAPEIREPIAGGNARITMGAGTVEQQRKDAEALVATLRAGRARVKWVRPE